MRPAVRDAMAQAHKDLTEGWPVEDLLPDGAAVEWVLEVPSFRKGQACLRMRMQMQAEGRLVHAELRENDVPYMRPYVRVIEWARWQLTNNKGETP